MTIALEYQTRLSRLLTEHYGVGGEGLRRRAKVASRCLPENLARRLLWLADTILRLKAGESLDDPAAFRREAEAILRELAAVPAGDIAERKTARKRLRYLLHGLILLSPVLGLINWFAVQFDTAFRQGHTEWLLAFVIAAYVLWPGYLFWFLDRTLANTLSASRLEIPLRALLLALFAWSPGPWIALLLSGGREDAPLSLEAYIERHPDCYRNGRVTCHRCGGGNIWMALDSAILFHRVYSHTCRQCGVELYQSG